LHSQALALALADFDEVLKAQPNNVDALSGRGQARVLVGQVKAAVEDAEAALKVGKPTPTLLCSVACIYARLARRLEAAPGPRASSAAVRRHEDRAVGLIAEAVRALPAERRRKFWREQVEKDVTLRGLLRHPQMAQLARTHGASE